jgi:hypothetical protein
MNYWFFDYVEFLFTCEYVDSLAYQSVAIFSNRDTKNKKIMLDASPLTLSFS